jgi:hypothetical protein
MENTSIKAKFIKRDANVSIQLGGWFIEKLIEVLTYIGKDIPTDKINKYHEELKDLNDIIKNEKQFSEEWMKHVTTLSLMLQEIDRQAVLQDQSIEEDIETYFKNSMGDVINSENNPPAPQSQ